MSDYNLTFREALIKALEGETIEGVDGSYFVRSNKDIRWENSDLIIGGIDLAEKKYRIKKPRVKRAQYTFLLDLDGLTAPKTTATWYKDDDEFFSGGTKSLLKWFERGPEREFDE